MSILKRIFSPRSPTIKAVEYQKGISRPGNKSKRTADNINALRSQEYGSDSLHF